MGIFKNNIKVKVKNKTKQPEENAIQEGCLGVGIDPDSQNVSDCQEEILYLLWQKEERMTSKEILDYFNTNKNKDWKKQTLNTFLLRLREKGLLRMDRIDKKNYYSPTMSCEKYEVRKLQGILDDSFHGSIGRMMMALTGGRKLTKEEVDEIMTIIKK